MAKIVIAGGTGLLGQALEKALLAEQHEVFILSRSPKKPNHIKWDVQNGTIDNSKIDKTEYVINLCGENVGDKRWSAARKEALLSSRVDTTKFLFEIFRNQNSLKQYLTASGVNAYPLNQGKKVFKESEAFGDDYLSLLVKKWEESADLFTAKVPVYKLRISMVLTSEGGALSKLLPLAKLGMASPIGKGTQSNNWVHLDDVSYAFIHGIKHQLKGAYNLTGESISNRTFMRELMKGHGKRMWAPSVPRFVMKLFMGERATIVIDGAYTSSNKLEESGFQFEFPNLKGALVDLFQK